MAESQDPRRQRPADSPEAADEVYDLAGDDPEEADGSPNPVLPDILDDAEAPAPPEEAAGPRPPAAPLPRLWKATPDPDAEGLPGRRTRSKTPPPEPAPPPPEKERSRPPKAKAPDRRADDDRIERVGTVKKLSEKAEEAKQAREVKRERKVKAERAPERKAARGKVLAEETPNLDTYEARQKVRFFLGVALFGAGLIGAFLLIRSVWPSSSSEEVVVDSTPVGTPTNALPSPLQLEQEARALLDRAKDAAKRNDTDLAVSFLQRVVKSYPNTAAAREATEALSHPAQNLPLFVDRPVVVASASEPKAQDPEPKAAVVEATKAAVPKATTAEVGLVYPPTPSEAARAQAKEEFPQVGRPLPPGFHARPGTTAHESGWALEIVGERDGATMVLVPGGEFDMGRDDGGEPSERPAHRVKLSTYYIDQHEVTARQFDLFQKDVGPRPDRVRALAKETTPLPSSEDSPVVMVSAKEAKDYASWAGKRLPTEAQWEMAARGTDGRFHPWGMSPPDWPRKREPRQIDPVMSFASDVSPYGAYDMAGNAWEWTKDWYDPRFFQLYKNQTISDPGGPTIVPHTYQLTVKGGSKTWTVTRREGIKYEQHLPFLGFRCVLQVEGPGNAFEPAAKSGPSTGPAPGQPAAGASIPF